MIMWTIGYLLMWVVVIWVGCVGVFAALVGSQFQKELGWVGIVMILISAGCGWKLMQCINITVNLPV